MTYFDTRNLDKLTPAQRERYEEFLKAYPQLQPKMETSRQLNTPGAQEQRKKAAPPPPPQQPDEFDPSSIETEQKNAPPPKPDRPLGTLRIDPKRSSSQSIKNDIEEEEEARRHLREPPPEYDDIDAGYEPQYQQQQQRQQEPPRQQQQQQQRPPQQPPRPAPKQKPFSPIGKTHPVLQRMRQSLGMDELEKPVQISLQGVTYEMKRLMREDLLKASSLANFRSLDDTELRSNIETAAVAYAVRKIDDTPLEDVFDVPYFEDKVAARADRKLNSLQRADKGAQMFFEFLKDSPSELTESLVAFYEENFPTVNLKDPGTSYGLCPEANCAYKALVSAGEVRFCPIHGKPLAREEELPNP